MNLFENPYPALNFIKLLIILTPCVVAGIIILKRITKNLNLPLLIPGGIILGLTLFTFLLNLVFNVSPGKPGIWISYILIVLLSGFLLSTVKWSFPPLNKKILAFCLMTFIFWLGLVTWKANFALIGGDTRSYYAIAGSFINGNFPSVTSWQPDVELAYHTGALELLGALNYLTNISFLSLHLVLSVVFIVCSIQILIWIICTEFSITKFIIGNISAFIAFVGFGFLKIIYPVFPIKPPSLTSINDLVIWLRNLPSARESIELYGVSFNLDSLIYILFQNYGLAILFCILVILLNFKKSFFSLLVLLITLTTLALVNESIFVPALIPTFLWIIFIFSKKLWSKSSFSVILAFLITGIFILFQGGLITANLLSKDKTPSSIEIFPASPYARDYLINSQKSRLLETKDSWLPFGWVNVGIDLQVVIILFLLILSKPEKKLRDFCLLLFGFSIGAILTYNLIIPKYVLSNSNRILVLAYQFLSIIIVCLALTWALKIKSAKIKFATIIILSLIVILPSIIPSLAWMSTTRFGPGKLTFAAVEKTGVEKWLEKNTLPSDRFAILDVNSPHPSGAAKLMAITGIKTPLFIGGFKTYTIEPGPEYTDIVYSLNPDSLRKLKINKLIIDSKSFASLPEIRKTQLQNTKFFNLLFNEDDKNEWTRIYEIKNDYFQSGRNLDGTFESLSKIAPADGRYFIDSEKNFNPDYLRRPLIFTLRNRDLYFKVESGVYQHTEIPINQKDPVPGMNYDYLVLSDKTDPKSLCKCQPKLIWKYLNGKIMLWKTN